MKLTIFDENSKMYLRGVFNFWLVNDYQDATNYRWFGVCKRAVLWYARKKLGEQLRFKKILSMRSEMSVY
jgi:hypothetical protein